MKKSKRNPNRTNITKRYSEYEIPTTEGIAQYVSQIIVNSITGRPIFSADEVAAVISATVEVVGGLLQAGYRVHIDDYASVYIRRVIGTHDGKPYLTRSIKSRPIGKLAVAMQEDLAPLNAKDLYEMCLTKKQKEYLDRFGTMEDALKKRESNNEKITFSKDEDDE